MSVKRANSYNFAMGEQHFRKTSDRHSHEAFLRCSAIVLPYLNPAELASVSSACKILYRISKTITSRRTSDVSRGLENLPIPFLNPIAGDSQPYSYFLYTSTQTLRVRSDSRRPWGSDDDARLCREEGPPDPFLFRVEGASGCECARGCGDHCPCLNAGEFLLTLECGPSCKCESGCGNRVTQGGVTVRLKMVKDEKKGWGLYAAELIPSGRFVCEYAGNFWWSNCQIKIAYELLIWTRLWFIFNYGQFIQCNSDVSYTNIIDRLNLYHALLKVSFCLPKTLHKGSKHMTISHQLGP